MIQTLLSDGLILAGLVCLVVACIILLVALRILQDILDDGSAGAGAHTRDAIREALKRSHPDTGGSDEAFRRVQRAREILEATR